MSDETARQQGAADAIATARSKLAEIEAEKSLPADAVTLFGQVIAIAETAHNRLLDVAGAFGEFESQTDDRFIAHGQTTQLIEQRVAALEARPANVQEVRAEGFDFGRLTNALTRIQNARETGAISGVTADALEDVLGAFGAMAPVTPPPATPAADTAPAAEAGAQAPTEQSAPETPAQTETSTDAAPAQTGQGDVGGEAGQQPA